jgi:hypothetical protein
MGAVPGSVSWRNESQAPSPRSRDRLKPCHLERVSPRTSRKVSTGSGARFSHWTASNLRGTFRLRGLGGHSVRGDTESARWVLSTAAVAVDEDHNVGSGHLVAPNSRSASVALSSGPSPTWRWAPQKRSVRFRARSRSICRRGIHAPHAGSRCGRGASMPRLPFRRDRDRDRERIAAGTVPARICLTRSEGL